MAEAPEIKTIITQLRRPSGRPGDHGVAVEGAYIVVDGTVTLTDRAGKPVSHEGKGYSRKLEPGENPRTAAAALTKKFRLALLGKSGSATGFSGPIQLSDERQHRVMRAVRCQALPLAIDKL